MRKVNESQLPLPGLETHLCECGCGVYFMRATRKHNPQRYINGTHKKRAARALKAERDNKPLRRSSALGPVLLRSQDENTTKHIMGQMTPIELDIMSLLWDAPYSPDDVSKAVKALFNSGRLPYNAKRRV